MHTLRLLGDVALAGPDGPVQVPTEKGRLLVVRLGCAEREVPRSRIVADLWPDQPERAGRRRLSETLSRLRRACGSDVVVPEADTLALRADVDLLTFRARLRQARIAPDVGTLRAVHDAYRGPLAPGLSADWLDPIRDTVDEGLDWALGALLTALRRAGRPAEAEIVGRELLERDPLRESAVRELLQVLAIGGRSAEALGMFRRFRDRLRRDLGDEPDPETLALVRELRRQPHGPAPVPPAQRLPLVDRSSAIADLRVYMERAQHGDPTPVALVGPPGAGRTRMLEAIARAARWRDIWVVRGGAEPLAAAVSAAIDPRVWGEATRTRPDAFGPGGLRPERVGDLLAAMATVRPMALLVDAAPHPTVAAAADALADRAWVVRAGRWDRADALVELGPITVSGARTLAREIHGDPALGDAAHRWSGGRPAMLIDALVHGPPFHSAWLDAAWTADPDHPSWFVDGPEGRRPVCPAVAERLSLLRTPEPEPPVPSGDLTVLLGAALSPPARSALAAELADRVLDAGLPVAARAIHVALLAHAGAWPQARRRHQHGLAAVALAEDDPRLAAVHLARGGADPVLEQALALANADPAAADGPDPDLRARALADAGRLAEASEEARDPATVAELAARMGDADAARQALGDVSGAPAWLRARVLAAEGRHAEARATVRPAPGDPLVVWATAIAVGDRRDTVFDGARNALDAALGRREPAHRPRWLARWQPLVDDLVAQLGHWPATWPVPPGHRRQPVAALDGGTVEVVWPIHEPRAPDERRHALADLLGRARGQGGAPTATDLAFALGVSPRTVGRDLQALAAPPAESSAGD